MTGAAQQRGHASGREALVRDAEAADMAAVQGIYAHYVLTSLATFEETPPTLEEMLSRRQASLDLGLPYLVAEAGAEILGFAYASAYHRRAAYRFAIEDSVYVAAGLGGRGIGAALLGEVIARCERGPWRQMLAIVGDSANAGSVALHRRFGFELAGTLRSVGFKFGQWVDTPILQRSLGPGESRPAAAASP
jgi:L-amino acid N-acyltransferase YncA